MKKLNVPETQIDYGDVVMIVGVGGGFDVFTGLPFMTRYTKRFVLVNSSPHMNFHYREASVDDHPEYSIGYKHNLVGNYTVGRQGVGLVKKAYQSIIDKHKVDTILAVDGGVDSLQRGDEQDSGTILEDFISLAALNEVKLSPHGHCGQGDEGCKILCCAGFGTETEENLNHYRVLENMAALTDAFIGSFSLTKDSQAFKEYVADCERAWDGGNRKSHIQTKIISAVNGRFGSNNIYSEIDARVANSTKATFISPLSSIYWMFDLEKVVQRNLAIPVIKNSNTFVDAKIMLRNWMSFQKLRSHDSLPL
jgi:hypothetical protein